METVKVSALPSKLPWIEGADYSVVAGSPVEGDAIRKRTAPGVTVNETFCRHYVGSPVVPAKKTLGRGDVIELLPGGVMKACRDSTDAAVIKNFYKFLAKDGFTFAEGVALAAFLKAKTIIDQAQEDAFIAAWP